MMVMMMTYKQHIHAHLSIFPSLGIQLLRVHANDVCVCVCVCDLFICIFLSL